MGRIQTLSIQGQQAPERSQVIGKVPLRWIEDNRPLACKHVSDDPLPRIRKKETNVTGGMTRGVQDVPLLWTGLKAIPLVQKPIHLDSS